MEKIRNFSIIAHIDHGKSTLADRMLEITNTIAKREMKERVLDQMDLEQEKGITIKMQPVTIKHKYKSEEYTLNLIDTPGHIDFSYEVSRSLRAVDGVILLVDSTQGVQAQTISVLDMAKERKLKIIPVLSKIDFPHSMIDDVIFEIVEILGCDIEDVIHTSGKTGEGVEDLLNVIVEKIPSPIIPEVKESKALIFDFSFDSHSGISAYARVFSGEFIKNDSLKFLSNNKNFQLKETGIFSPDKKPKDRLRAGEIGYFTTGIKEPGIALVGDTIAKKSEDVEAFSGYKEPSPVIWASIYPQDGDDFSTLERVLKELKLSDSSLVFEEERSNILGKGFRCGFLGMLHLEIITERIKREYNLELIITSPSTEYVIHTKKGSMRVSSATEFPDHHDIEKVEEQFVKLRIISNAEHLSNIQKLITNHEGEVAKIEDFQKGKTVMYVDMPLREFMRKFFDKLKSATSGYASLSYDFIEKREADVSRLDVLIRDEIFPAFSTIVSKQKVEKEARKLVDTIYEELPRELFQIKIQAKAGGRIIASKTLSALRKDVTAKLYGGDITRKMKLREKQKKGKDKRDTTASIKVSHDTFLKVLQKKDSQ